MVHCAVFIVGLTSMHPVTNSSLVRMPSLLVSSLLKTISTLSLNWLAVISMKRREGDIKDPNEKDMLHTLNVTILFVRWRFVQSDVIKCSRFFRFFKHIYFILFCYYLLSPQFLSLSWLAGMRGCTLNYPAITTISPGPICVRNF